MRTALIIITGVIVLVLTGFFLATIGLKDTRRMPIVDVDISKVPDGSYSGKFYRARWFHDVRVTVREHRLTGIKHMTRFAAPNRQFIERAIKEMIAKQSIIIDAVSGATVTTKAFQKAVENALTEGVWAEGAEQPSDSR